MSLLRVPIYPTRNLAVEIDPGARSIVAGAGITLTTNADGSITITNVGASGTVTSVAATGSTGLTIGGSPITTSGTLTFTLSANLQSWSGIAPSSKADASSVWTLTGNQTSTGTKTIEDTNATKMVFSRTGTGANSSVEWKTTGGSVFAGMQGAGVWAIAGTASLTTSPWFTVTSTAAQVNGQTVYHTGNLPAVLASYVLKAGDTMSGGLAFGSAVGASNADVTRHIALYSNTHGFGITSSRTNYVVPTGSRHVFVVNAVDSVSIGAPNASDTLLVPGSLRSTGTGAILHSYDRTSSRQWGWYGTGDVFRLWNGSADVVTFSPTGNQGNAGYIWPDVNTAGSKKLSRISIGTAAPGALVDGELYLRY